MSRIICNSSEQKFHSPSFGIDCKRRHELLGKLLYDRDPERANHWLRFSAFYDNPYAQRALDQRTSPTIAACVTRLLYRLRRIIRDDTEQASHGPGFGIDRKRRRELLEKRIAMGHKPDDHEDMQMQGFSM